MTLQYAGPPETAASEYTRTLERIKRLQGTVFEALHHLEDIEKNIHGDTVKQKEFDEMMELVEVTQNVVSDLQRHSFTLLMQANIVEGNKQFILYFY